MKRLICAKDISDLCKQGEKVLYIDEDTIITPSAKDAARNCGVSFSTEQSCDCCGSEKETQAAKNPFSETIEGVDAELIYNIVKKLAEKGMLQHFM